MLFLPKGPRLKMVADPEELGNEFRRANAIIQETTQYQWAQDIFTDPLFLATGKLVAIEFNGSQGSLQTTNVQEPILTTNGGGTPAADLFHIPYNTGYVPVDDTDVTWSSSYPELVWVIFSFQYLRARWLGGVADDTFSNDDLRPRAKIRVSVDDVQVQGAGIYQVQTGSGIRGDGTQARSEASAIITVQHLPPGTHTVVAEAAQSTAQQFSTNIWEQLWTAPRINYTPDPPDKGVIIAGRKMIVARFALGGRLGA